MPINRSSSCCLFFILVLALFISGEAFAQPPGGGPNAKDIVILEDFDKDGNGFLNAEERDVAKEFLAMMRPQNQNNRRPRFGGRGQSPTPGAKIEISDVKTYPDKTLYDTSTLRTFFLTFENDEWEKELALFKTTDVEVPANLVVDGKEYRDIGVSFRGASSYFMISEGMKRSLNLSIDLADSDQRLYGFKSLNLLNCNGDPTMMSSLLYSYLSNKKIPAPKVNYVRVVINGENWGVYVSSQQFNKVFVKERYETSKGARWKVHGSPRGDGGLRYLGDDFEPYRERFEIKSKDKKESWEALVNLCKVLNETPADKLASVLEPILNIEGALWFLAVDVATANSDGYWTRASDYNIYLDPKGKFHILPHDMNEAFQVSHRGPGGGGGRRGGGPGAGAGGARGPALDPLIGIDDDRKPLRSVLLMNPQFRQQYLENLKQIAEMMKWENMGPRIKAARNLIATEVAADTKKLMSTEAFEESTSDEKPGENSQTLRAFLESRTQFLLDYEKIKSLPESTNTSK